MEEPDTSAAFNDKEIGSLLQPDDRKVLNNFVYHLKSRRRKEDEQEAKRIEQEKLISK
jgi:hypothetical protein